MRSIRYIEECRTPPRTLPTERRGGARRVKVHAVFLPGFRRQHAERRAGAESRLRTRPRSRPRHGPELVLQNDELRHALCIAVQFRQNHELQLPCRQSTFAGHAIDITTSVNAMQSASEGFHPDVRTADFDGVAETARHHLSARSAWNEKGSSSG